MPYAIVAFLRVNELFASIDKFEPAALLEGIGDAATVLDGAERLGLFSLLETEDADEVRRFMDRLPRSLDAAVMAALRSGLERGVRTQVTWQPGYDFELRAWESSEGSAGLINLHVFSPHPEEKPRPTTLGAE